MTLAAERPDSNPRDESIARWRRTLEGVIGVPATEGNRIDVLLNGDEIFAAMLDAIDEAHHTVDFLTFIYWNGEIGAEFAHRLAARARAGVRVRLLLDAWGAKTMDPSLITMMEHEHVLVRWFRPLRRLHPGELNHRTHRKVLIVDEAVGFTGGVGIADEWKGNARDEHEWRDTHFRIQGPAVDGMRAAFLDNWAETDPQLFDPTIDRFPEQPKPGNAVAQCVRGAAETGWSDVATLFRTLLQVAEQRVRIATAYFVPDDELLERLCAARQRGVEVEVLLPGPHADKRFVQLASEAVYEQLLDAGVKLWAFQPSMLHAKVMTIDGILANVGSANLNAR
ncbi:MAG: cardiolipin synthase, partial [Actinomycetota bacterium]|nr:cardiolipin synthase [Actinomycetota bacterium]